MQFKANAFYSPLQGIWCPPAKRQAASSRPNKICMSWRPEGKPCLWPCRGESGSGSQCWSAEFSFSVTPSHCPHSWFTSLRNSALRHWLYVVVFFCHINKYWFCQKLKSENSTSNFWFETPPQRIFLLSSCHRALMQWPDHNGRLTSRPCHVCAPQVKFLNSLFWTKYYK